MKEGNTMYTDQKGKNILHPNIPEESILLIPDAALVLKCSEGYVRRLIHEKKLYAYKIGKTYRIPRESLIMYLDSLLPTPAKEKQPTNQLF